jgi:hypothetical protein
MSLVGTPGYRTLSSQSRRDRLEVGWQEVDQKQWVLGRGSVLNGKSENARLI